MNHIDMARFYKALVTISATCALAWTFLTTAHAADVSEWSQDHKSVMRLIAGTNKASAPFLVGIEIKLEPGWHTYWRYPGESGVPPRFDFSSSSNLQTADVLYPAPHIHKDEGGQSLGYENNVIFPVRIIPKQPGKPVRLRVTLAYAVCKKLCIPATGYAELSLGVGESAQGSTMAAAEARVPKLVSAADIDLSVRRINNGTRPSVTVDLRAPINESVQLFVEGPEPGWALPIPKPEPSGTADHRQFSFELDGLPPGVDPNGPLDLTFTIVEGSRGFEVKNHVD